MSVNFKTKTNWCLHTGKMLLGQSCIDDPSDKGTVLFKKVAGKSGYRTVHSDKGN